ncbi:MAG TPA: LptF/LptG family permease [Rariglobus sp.]|jgi:lipopolysaccharide export system permease protein|nr:LptF/LptG family permease [Rariglobus sp.]
MKLLHRHIFASVLFSCLVAAGLFAFVLIVGNAFKDLIGYMLAGQLSIESFVKLTALLAPYVAVHALPMGMLTAVLLVLGRMSSQQEITAMRAAGLSLGYVARPIFMIAVLGIIAGLAINCYYMPRSRTAYRETLNEAVRQNPLSFIVPKTFIRNFPGVVVYVNRKDGEQMKDFWLWQLDDQKRVKLFARAKSGHVDYVAADNKLVLTLSNVSVETRDEKNPEDFTTPHPIGTSDQMAIDLKLDNIFGKQQFNRKLSWLTFSQLLDERKRLETTHASARERMAVSIALHEKIANAFTILAFTIIAIPLGIKISRKETTANLGLALGLALGYYFLNVIVGWLDKQPALRPDLLLWVAPVLYIALGTWLFRRVGRA